MIKHITYLIVFFSVFVIQAQGFVPGSGTQNPATWEAKVKQQDATHYQLILEAQIEPEWHIYSQFTDPAGPIPLALEFLKAGEDFTLDGPAKESETEVVYSDIFEVDETFWSDTATITQDITLTNENTKLVKLILTYQVCKEVCINEEKYIVFDLENKKGTVVADFNAFESFGTASEVEKEVDQIEPVEKVVKQEEQKDLWTLFFCSLCLGFSGVTNALCLPYDPNDGKLFYQAK